MIPSPVDYARKEGHYEGSLQGLIVGAVIATIIASIFIVGIVSSRPPAKPGECAPFVHVAVFRDGERVYQVCRTIDGGVETR
jgi:hypothetical protein